MCAAPDSAKYRLGGFTSIPAPMSFEAALHVPTLN